MTRLFGHEAPVAAFREGLASNRLHHAWLLTGPRGVGKATFANMAARRLLAQATGPQFEGEGLDVPASHPIARLLDAESHPDFRLLERLPKDAKQREGLRKDRSGDEELARSITVEQIRALSKLFGSTPFLSPWRVAIIDSIDDLEPPAANALLKSLEEPPANCLFLLVSHAPAGLLPTIRSRCLNVRFGALDDEAMTSALKSVLPDLDAGELAALVPAGDGAPGLALQRRGLDIGKLDDELERLLREGDPYNRARGALAAKLALKAAQARYEIFLSRVPRHIAAAAKTLTGSRRAAAIGAYERARALGDSAIGLSLDPAMVTFELAGIVAGLAPTGGDAPRRANG